MKLTYYLLSSLLVFCTVRAEIDLRISDGNLDAILSASGTTPGTPSVLVNTGAGTSNPQMITYYGDVMYWADNVLDRISSANLDGTNVQTVFQYSGPNVSPIGISATSTHLYWTELNNDVITRSNLDGSNDTVLLTGLGNPQGIFVTDSFIYWVENNTNDEGVYRANLDGSGETQLVDSGTTTAAPFGIAVTDQYIFWSDVGLDSIFRTDLNGNNQTVIYNVGGSNPRGLSVLNDEIYWVDNALDRGYKSDLDGGNLVEIVTGGLDAPNGIIAVPEPSYLGLAVIGLLFCLRRRRRLGRVFKPMINSSLRHS